jgi:hypothetical protein
LRAALTAAAGAEPTAVSSGVARAVRGGVNVESFVSRDVRAGAASGRGRSDVADPSREIASWLTAPTGAGTRRPLPRADRHRQVSLLFRWAAAGPARSCPRRAPACARIRTCRSGERVRRRGRGRPRRRSPPHRQPRCRDRPGWSARSPGRWPSCPP